MWRRTIVGLSTLPTSNKLDTASDFSQKINLMISLKSEGRLSALVERESLAACDGIHSTDANRAVDPFSVRFVLAVTLCLNR